MEFEIGQQVKIGQNIFEGTTDKRELAIRGRIGTVTYCYGPAIEPGEYECYEVEVNGESWPVHAGEMSAIQSH